MPFGYDGVLPSHLEPVLDRISETSLVTMFENELVFCLKSLRALSKTPQTASNAQRRLLRTQFRSCIEKYQRHVKPSTFIAQIIETGEAILDIPGFHRLAEDDCFEVALQKISHNHVSKLARRATSASTARSSTGETSSGAGSGLDSDCIRFGSLGGGASQARAGLSHGATAAAAEDQTAILQKGEHVSPMIASSGDALETSGFDDNNGIVSAMAVQQRLKYMAHLGKLVAQFLAAIEIDPCLKSVTVVSKVFKVLNSFKSIARETLDADTNKDTREHVWCTYICTYHIMSICQELAKSGWISKVNPTIGLLGSL
eukprot:jgi/Hompol1/1747/HPOL_000003-RA